MGFSLSVYSLSVLVCSRVTATTSMSSSFNSRHSCRKLSWSCCFLLSGSSDLLSGTLKAMLLVLCVSLCVISLEVSSLLRSSSDSIIESCFLNSWTSLEFEFDSPSVSFKLTRSSRRSFIVDMSYFSLLRSVASSVSLLTLSYYLYSSANIAILMWCLSCKEQCAVTQQLTAIRRRTLEFALPC